jgi:hypothetical protein
MRPSVNTQQRNGSSVASLFVRSWQPEICHWLVDSVQIVLFGVACGVGTDAARKNG